MEAPDATGYGAGWADYDNDGDLDLYVANFGASRLFRNDGDGSFADVTAPSGVADPDGDHRTMAWPGATLMGTLSSISSSFGT